MIYKVIVTNHIGESLELELARPEKSGLAVTSIEGIGPSDASINTTDLATTDGSLFNTARLQKRNIVIDIRYLNAKTIEEARLLSYKYFPIKRNITLEFVTENRDVKIEGYVEKNEPDIFSDEVSTRLSIICPDPYFYDVIGNQASYSSITPEFEFPLDFSPLGYEETRDENNWYDSSHINEYNFTKFEKDFSYSSGRFTLLRDIPKLILKLKTSEYSNAGRRAEGAVYYNDSRVIYHETPETHEGSYIETEYVVTNAKTGDTFYTMTPSGSGWPKQTLTIETQISDGGCIEFGSIKPYANGTIVYNGDLETGVQILIHANGTVEDLTIYNLTTDEFMNIDTNVIKAITGNTIIAGDSLLINTVMGKKSVTLMRGTKVWNILNALDKNADWFKLQKGDNLFAYTLKGELSDVTFSVNSDVVYEGI